MEQYFHPEFWNNVLQRLSSNAFLYSVAIIVVSVLAKKYVSLYFQGENELQNGDKELLSDMVIPARCIKYKRFKSLRGKSHTTVVQLSNLPSTDEWNPVLLFCNRKSGINQGIEILNSAKKLLCFIQVYNSYYY